MKKLFILFLAISTRGAQVNAQSPLNLDSLIASGTTVEVDAQYASGESSWQEFLKKHIDYDAPTFNGAPEGTYHVKIKFTVFADGHLGNFKRLTKHGYGTEDEVIRILKKSADWNPKTRNGVPMDAEKVQAVTFFVGR